MKKLYNISVAICAVISIVLAILDICNVLNASKAPYYQIDIIILLFFTIDYGVRFFLSKERKKFFKENIFDLIAIIPFNSIFAAFRAFRLFRLLKFTKLAKLSRMVRVIAFFGVLKRKLEGILRTNGFLYVFYANIVLIVIASVVIKFAENMPFSDALWWSIVTCTTVGYGDISPTSTVGRLVAVVLMIFGIGLIGMLTGAITTYFTSRSSDEKSKTYDDLELLIEDMTEEQKEKLLEIAKIIIK